MLKQRHADAKRRLVLKREQSRDLRQSATEPERKLWARLRAGQLDGIRFRRQQPMGPYIVDFYCSAAKLIVELDGGQHSEEKNIAYDEARSDWLAMKGYRVLRFWNEEFLRDPEIALEAIWRAVQDRAGPLPEFASRIRPSLKGRVDS